MTFAETLRKAGYIVREVDEVEDDYGIPHDVEPFHQVYASELDTEPICDILDTDEEQPELREWCEGELQKRGAWGFDYWFNEDDEWVLDVMLNDARVSVSTAANSKTQCAMSALVEVL